MQASYIYFPRCLQLYPRDFVSQCRHTVILVEHLSFRQDSKMSDFQRSLSGVNYQHHPTTAFVPHAQNPKYCPKRVVEGWYGCQTELSSKGHVLNPKESGPGLNVLVGGRKGGGGKLHILGVPFFREAASAGKVLEELQYFKTSTSWSLGVPWGLGVSAGLSMGFPWGCWPRFP